MIEPDLSQSEDVAGGPSKTHRNGLANGGVGQLHHDGGQHRTAPLLPRNTESRDINLQSRTLNMLHSKFSSNLLFPLFGYWLPRTRLLFVLFWLTCFDRPNDLPGFPST